MPKRRPAAASRVQTWSSACSVSAVQPTREALLQYYGTVGAKGLPHKRRLYQVEKVVEKPTPTLAEQELIVPGMRAGYYLCFFGMHVLTAEIMEILDEHDDVQKVNANFDIPEEIMEKVAAAAG